MVGSGGMRGSFGFRSKPCLHNPIRTTNLRTCRWTQDAFGQQFWGHVGDLQSDMQMFGSGDGKDDTEAQNLLEQNSMTRNYFSRIFRTVPNVCVLISLRFPARTRLRPKSDNLATKPRRSISLLLSRTLAA